jgi:hypothetical protein
MLFLENVVETAQLVAAPVMPHNSLCRSMKTYLAIFLLAALGLRAEIEFSGFFTTSSKALFSLTETNTRRSSGWLEVGQSFGGCTVLGFDPEHEIISLKQGERLLKIPIRSSKVKDGRTTIVAR